MGFFDDRTTDISAANDADGFLVEGKGFFLGEMKECGGYVFGDAVGIASGCCTPADVVLIEPIGIKMIGSGSSGSDKLNGGFF